MTNEQLRNEFKSLIWKTATEGGAEVYDILPPVNPFDRNANRQGVFQKVLDRLKAFFAKYYEIANGDFAK